MSNWIKRAWRAERCMLFGHEDYVTLGMYAHCIRCGQQNEWYVAVDPPDLPLLSDFAKIVEVAAEMFERLAVAMQQLGASLLPVAAAIYDGISSGYTVDTILAAQEDLRGKVESEGYDRTT